MDVLYMAHVRYECIMAKVFIKNWPRTTYQYGKNKLSRSTMGCRVWQQHITMKIENTGTHTSKYIYTESALTAWRTRKRELERERESEMTLKWRISIFSVYCRVARVKTILRINRHICWFEKIHDSHIGEREKKSRERRSAYFFSFLRMHLIDPHFCFSLAQRRAKVTWMKSSANIYSYIDCDPYIGRNHRTKLSHYW